MASAELQTLCRTYPRAKGLCVIIANSRGNLPEMPLLEGVKTDLVNMKRTFETLKFAVMTREDCSAAQMVSLFHCVALFSEYPPSYRRIAVVFAGHGVEGALCAHDGTVPIDKIFDQFQPGNCHPSIGGIPKLFFIDSCRGKQKMEPVVVERGATAVPSKVVSPRGNILVAYSTLEGYKAHEAEEGGIWATELSKQLLHDKSLPDIIVSVNQTLMVKFQNSALSLYLQQPECNLTINECINLLKESKEECPSLGEASSNYGTSSLAQKLIPQLATSRPSRYEAGNHDNGQHDSFNVDGTEYYQQLLHTYVREGMIQNYKEHQEKLPFGDKILYRTRIEGTLGEDVCAIQSEYMESEDESREQAAREAVSLIQCQRTDRGSICSPPSITGTHSSFSVTEGPPSIAGDHTMAEDTPCDEASLHSSRNYQQELNEWCQRHNEKVNRDCKTSGLSHMCSIKIKGKEFTSKLCIRKKDAKEDAAMKVMQWLQGQQQATPPAPSQPGSMRLKEYCERHREKQLTCDYELLPAPANGPFKCKLTIKSPLKASPIEVNGALRKSKQDAKHNAADMALQSLNDCVW